jgi:2-polyprenyl-3-methyl-5-hydroxy-6-metoxy-1,4-benzoquinol methylase
MIGLLDPEGVETRVLHDLVDFRGKDVLEIGCGDGRMTWRYADDAASVLAFDPDEPSIAAAREETPERLKAKVAFRVAGMMDIDLADAAYDVGLLSWSI